MLNLKIFLRSLHQFCVLKGAFFPRDFSATLLRPRFLINLSSKHLQQRASQRHLVTKRPRLILKSSRFSNWSTSSLCFEVGNHAPHSPDAKESFRFHCCERHQKKGVNRGGEERRVSL
ncbi:uncharacterized protein LOC117178995 [Belonocnema kinseyi]|uniref:uncharacterized protein LOC117178995 n=1 Tax=Belonocnema kinseyi TaxID=2817044 RepID=UPI00143D7A8B|nr:uncharacterized protein LOC117178995 [Belonocnema kinseyi]